MRETRLSGSEGGGGELNRFSLPLSTSDAHADSANLRLPPLLRFSVLIPFPPPPPFLRGVAAQHATAARPPDLAHAAFAQALLEPVAPQLARA